jgi:hypothetical protein
MSVPVTNEAYSQQNNQIFDWAKTATPQQIEAAKQGLPKDSPLLLAIGMGVQYQQQTRAPNPQAPQKTVMEQKLGEFTQASSQGLPQVGQNQMAMQQTAQQNPMFGAGLAVAPENTEQAPAPQQMAATGGITALAHGGEVRGFEEGGSLDALTALADKEEGDEIGNEGRMFENFAKQAKNTGTDLLDKYKAYTNTAPSAGLPSINLGGDPSSPTGAYKAPTLDTAISDMGVPTTGGTNPKIKSTLSDFEEAPKAKPKVKAHHSKKDSAPAPGSSAEAIAASPTAKGETYKTPEVAAVLPAALTQDESIANIQKLLGSEADMSEEVGMAREAAANASRDKGLGALVGGIGGMLSAQTPYMGQAVGAGLMSGLSSYQQGAKEQGTADKELMALQMAEKKAKLAPHREAATMYLTQKAAEAKAEAESRGRMQEIYGKNRGDLSVEQLKGANAKELARFNAGTTQALEVLKGLNAQDLERLKSGTLSSNDKLKLYGSLARSGVYNEDDLDSMFAAALKMGGASPTGSSQPLAPVGNSGVFYSPKK